MAAGLTGKASELREQQCEGDLVVHVLMEMVPHNQPKLLQGQSFQSGM